MLRYLNKILDFYVYSENAEVLKSNFEEGSTPSAAGGAPIFFKAVQCKGDESQLDQCDRDLTDDIVCGHSEDVGVNCQ